MLTKGFATALATCLLIGCEERPRGDSLASLETNAAARGLKRQADDLGQEFNGVVETTKAGLARSKEGIVAAAEESMNQLDRRIAELGQKADGLTDEMKAQREKALDALRQKRAQLGQKLEELKNSNQQSWNDLKARFDAAWADVESAYRDAKSNFAH
jgi:outer membrane murein-binding lipoprotein Lpp